MGLFQEICNLPGLIQKELENAIRHTNPDETERNYGTSPKVKIPGPDSVTTELQQALKEDWIPILLNSSKNGKKSQYFLTNLMSST